MARVAISEFAGKTLLLGESYQGVSCSNKTHVEEASLPTGQYVVKVDDGTKKRNKLGLVKVGLDAAAAKAAAALWLEEGYTRVLIEPLVEHIEADEQYVSATLVRDGVSVLYKTSGGNSVEEGTEGATQVVIPWVDFMADTSVLPDTVPSGLVQHLVTAMKRYQLSFVEVNPFVMIADTPVLLDAAVEIDDTKAHRLPDWVEEHIQGKRRPLPAEAAVAALDAQSTAAFSLTVFNEDASIFTLLSGGGASLVMIDTLVDNGLQTEIGNYGEYSGAPNREETKRYTEELLKLLFASKAKKKVLVIAGGVANFTDVMTTFSGIIDACREHVAAFKQQSVMVRVRRGGPRQAEGLALLESFFKAEGITAVVSDPSVPLSQVAVDVAAFLKS